MSGDTANCWLALGALLIFVGALMHAVLASIWATRQTDPLNGWVRVMAWGAVMMGAGGTLAGAGALANWW